jgi:4-oxalocrotonate tautomerase
MPVIKMHVPDGLLAPQAEAALVEAVLHRFAELQESPVERIRAFLTVHPPTRYATGGQAGRSPGPFFEFVVMEGRPVEQRQALLTAFAQLLADATGVPVTQVRGMCQVVSPENWVIGDQPATLARKDHVARLRQGGH